MECAEVGSSNGLENHGDHKVNSSMLSHSASLINYADLPELVEWNGFVIRRSNPVARSNRVVGTITFLHFYICLL